MDLRLAFLLPVGLVACAHPAVTLQDVDTTAGAGGQPLVGGSGGARPLRPAGSGGAPTAGAGGSPAAGSAQAGGPAAGSAQAGGPVAGSSNGGAPTGTFGGGPAQGGSTPDSSCNTCVNGSLDGACAAEGAACQNDTACVQLLGCLNDCTSDACSQQCQSQHAAGLSRLSDLEACFCQKACPGPCAQECGGGAAGSDPGGACTHDVCQVGAALTPGCSPCASSLCALDPLCCSQAWDDICVGEASTLAECGCVGGVAACQQTTAWTQTDSSGCQQCLSSSCSNLSDAVGQTCPSGLPDACRTKCTDASCFCSCVTGYGADCSVYASAFYACVANNCQSACN